MGNKASTARVSPSISPRCGGVLFDQMTDIAEDGEWDHSVFPKHGVTVNFLPQFIHNCGGEGELRGMTTAKVCELYIKQVTVKSQSSFCDLLRFVKHDDYGENATVFISHAWNSLFLDVVSALLYHFKGKEETVVWFDIFSNNQHRPISAQYEWWASTLKYAISCFQHTVLVLNPWSDPIPYSRAWCLLEMYYTAKTESKFEVAMSENEHLKFLSDISNHGKRSIDQMLSTIKSRNSECSLKEDKEKILSVISNTIGFSKFDSVVFEQYRQWVLSTAEQNYKFRIESWGQTHPQTLCALNNLALLHQSQTDYSKAWPLHSQCLRLRQETLGETHPDTRASLHNLAQIYKLQGDLEKALPLHEQCYELAKESLGESHPSTLESLSSLATLYQLQGDFTKAEPLHVKCLLLMRSIFGESHANTLSSLKNLATLHKSRGAYTKARPLFEEILRLYKKTKGNSHPDTLMAMSSLAQFYKENKKFDKAQSLFEECYELMKTTLGDEHPATLSSLNNLALLYQSQGDYAKAIPLNKKCLDLKRSSLGEHHHSTLGALNNFAVLNQLTGDYDYAQELYEECLEIMETKLGSTHPSTLALLNNMSELYKYQRNYGV